MRRRLRNCCTGKTSNAAVWLLFQISTFSFRGSNIPAHPGHGPSPVRRFKHKRAGVQCGRVFWMRCRPGIILRLHTSSYPPARRVFFRYPPKSWTRVGHCRRVFDLSKNDHTPVPLFHQRLLQQVLPGRCCNRRIMLFVKYISSICWFSSSHARSVCGTILSSCRIHLHFFATQFLFLFFNSLIDSSLLVMQPLALSFVLG